ncbi:hypothetical protein ACH5RR_016522 [Cinchona calisaya]|uniref:RING-type domain-containing protein n=1 Tax=Cinchona calisaya TaxID=153742 RepID=A0ABD2ZXD9_9GENT
MNSTADEYGGSTNMNMIGGKAINQVVYSIGFSIVVLVVLILVSYISYKFNRYSSSAATNADNTFTHQSTADELYMSSTVPQLGGLNEATLMNYPKLLYSQAKLVKGEDSSPISSGCSICLADYKETDMLRLLPDCGHIFHLKCVDSWLKLHPTCPICRSSPLPLSVHQN